MVRPRRPTHLRLVTDDTAVPEPTADAGPPEPAGGGDGTEPALRASAGAAPVLAQFDALATFFGDGRKLTAKGFPVMADARVLVALLGTDDRLDVRIGDHQHTTRSAGELPRLMFTIRWATKAGALRKARGRLMATASWAKRDVLDRFGRAAAALLALGPLAALLGDGDDDADALSVSVDETVPSLLSAVAMGTIDQEAALDQLCAHLDGRYRFFGYLEDPDHRRALLDYHLDDVTRWLGTAGLLARRPAAPVGEATDPWLPPPFRGTLEGTEAGRWWTARRSAGTGQPFVYSPDFAPSGLAYELRVVLDEVRPEVTRTVLVPSEIGLGHLHDVLQVVLGWEDYHLHEFHIGGERYGVDDGEDWGEDLGESRRREERSTRLDAVTGVGDRFTYSYDFGDGWTHTITVAAVVPTDEAGPLPRCTSGANRCPPEDVGGPSGYTRYLEVLADPHHDEHEETLLWRGPFDPADFDVDEVNARLGD